MKFNTLYGKYEHKADYYTWEAKESDTDGLEYRDYTTEPTEVKCKVTVNAVGSLTLFSAVRLQDFALVGNLTDAGGETFMEDSLYIVLRAVPLINPRGYIYGYSHQVTQPSEEQVNGPLNRQPGWEWLDQAL